MLSTYDEGFVAGELDEGGDLWKQDEARLLEQIANDNLAVIAVLLAGEHRGRGITTADLATAANVGAVDAAGAIAHLVRFGMVRRGASGRFELEASGISFFESIREVLASLERDDAKTDRRDVVGERIAALWIDDQRNGWSR